MNIDRRSISSLSAEAAMKPTEFNATERSAYIRKTVRQVRTMFESGHTEDALKQVFPEFSEEYPGLFAMILRPEGFDEKSLSLMITLLDKMGSGSATQHTASIAVGQHLMNTYVTPTLEESSS
jgi:hypothetical protein